MAREQATVDGRRKRDVIPKWHLWGIVLLLLTGCGILCIQCSVFFGLTDNLSPLLPPAGQFQHPERTAFTVAVFSDFASRVDSVEKIGKEISRSDAEFVLCLGDMVRRRTHPDFLHVVKELRECISLPLYAVPGNWDWNDSDRQNTYKAHFGQDHYFFGYGDTLFIALNTAGGNLPKEQREFLKSTLERERVQFRRCVIFCHIPPRDPRNGGDHAMAPKEAEVFRNLIRPYKIDLILCGHIHCFSETDFAETRLVITPSAGQEIRDMRNNQFGCLFLNFLQDGSIQINRNDVTSETGFESLDYFLTVDLCKGEWFIIAVGLIVVALILLLCHRPTGYAGMGRRK